MSMDQMAPQITQEQLHAYVDGLLPEKEKARVEAFLDKNPEQAEQVAEWKAQNMALLQLFNQDEAVERTRDMNVDLSTGSNARFSGLFQVAAMIMLVVLGATGGWWARGTTDTQQAVSLQVATLNNARAAHVLYTKEVLHPVDVGADDEAHLVDWLSKRLDTKLIAPDLSASGYGLVGGRLLPSGDNPAAQFMYENSAGNRLTIYASPGKENDLASFQFENLDGFNSVYWQDSNLQYAIVGQMAHQQLLSIATSVYRQLI